MLRIAFAALLAAGLAATSVMTTSAQAQYDKPEAKTEPAKEKAKKPLSPGQVAMHERQKKCAAEWKEAKAAGKVEKGQTWPKFWSACNKRLKGGA